MSHVWSYISGKANFYKSGGVVVSLPTTYSIATTSYMHARLAV